MFNFGQDKKHLFLLGAFILLSEPLSVLIQIAKGFYLKENL
ncbi:hypothetical protein [Streptococcus sobrinus]|nr:hypothetical protein [Streptococcus sobrinus]